MDLNLILRTETRILDVGAPGPELAAALAARGNRRYLALVAPRDLVAVRARAAGIEQRFHALTAPAQAFKSSADLLILRGQYRRMLWSLRDLRHVEHIAVATGSGRPSAEVALAQVMGRLTRKLTPVGSMTLAGARFDVLAVATNRANRPRQYLSEVVGVAGLIRRLEDEGLSYAALRWFDSLPDLAPGEDLDLLVADGDLARLRSILAEEPGTIPVDVYSESGLPGADFQGAAYYVPDLARKILAGAVHHCSGCRVPSPGDHLLSLAYHAVYHKGERSGIPSHDAPAGFRDPDHDYGEMLTRLAAAVEVNLPETLEGLDDYLGRQGWRPPPDALRRLAGANPWIARQLSAEAEPPNEPPDVSVFLVRERALTVVGLDELVQVLEAVGFEVILTRDLDADARRRCADVTRGGNWGGGPFPVSGGGPAVAVVAVHYGPRPPDLVMHANYPRLTNADVLLAKLIVRDLVGSLVGPADRFNPLHSSDNEAEAWEYVAVAIPDAAPTLLAEVAARRDAYRTDAPVARVVSAGRRAKVEILEGPGGPVVRKTFAPRALRFMERELRALRELGPRLDAVLEVVDTGPHWYACPHYANTLGDLDTQWPPRLLPLAVVRDMVDVLRSIHGLGFDLIDAKPQNFLLDPQRGLRIVDFEFVYTYPHQPPPFEAAYWLRGVPADFAGDTPRGDLSYDWRWRRFTGLSPEALISGSVWRQHAERAIYRARHWPIAPTSRGRRIARARLRLLRGRLGGRYRIWARDRALASTAARDQ
ncbi:hypothetical protein [Pengzhenrongella phosphoraccumulans]|uniref:hypothetical protein n=1 Tax=Pengzhenrongella phosphoraccumulans TaxID=3114394 RepID=UPI00388E1783